MAHDDSAPNQKKKPGERPEGTFHFNPGNMAGKTIGTGNDEANEQANEQVNSDAKQDSQERQKHPGEHRSPK